MEVLPEPHFPKRPITNDFLSFHESREKERFSTKLLRFNKSFSKVSIASSDNIFLVIRNHPH